MSLTAPPLHGYRTVLDNSVVYITCPDNIVQRIPNIKQVGIHVYYNTLLILHLFIRLSLLFITFYGEIVIINSNIHESKWHNRKHSFIYLFCTCSKYPYSRIFSKFLLHLKAYLNIA